MKRWFGVLVVCAAVHVGGTAYAIEGFSGSTWGTMLHNFNDDRFQTLGNLNQGIDWVTFHGFLLTTFAEVRWRYQSNNGVDFNAWGPAVGVAVKRSSVRFGAEYYSEIKQNSDNHEGRAVIFMDWYYGWDLKHLGP
jgi:hypothetical protein